MDVPGVRGVRITARARIGRGNPAANRAASTRLRVQGTRQVTVKHSGKSVPFKFKGVRHVAH